MLTKTWYGTQTLSAQALYCIGDQMRDRDGELAELKRSIILMHGRGLLQSHLVERLFGALPELRSA